VHILLYSNAVNDARLCRFVITDEREHTTIQFDDHRVREFPETGIWMKGSHLFRFSRKQPPGGVEKQLPVGKLKGMQAKRTTIVRVTLCDKGCTTCTDR